MSILILRRITQRYRRDNSYKNGGIITGSGTSNYIPMFTYNDLLNEIEDREYAQPENEEE